MNMILICTDLDELDFISFRYLYTGFFQYFIYFLIKHYSSVLGWANIMINQHRYIMAFSHQITHRFILHHSYAASCGECTRKRFKWKTTIAPIKRRGDNAVGFKNLIPRILLEKSGDSLYWLVLPTCLIRRAFGRLDRDFVR